MYHASIEDSICIQEVTVQATEILDTDYKKVNMLDIMNSYTYLLLDKQNKLKSLLYKYKTLFNSTLGTWEIEPVNIKLKLES